MDKKEIRELFRKSDDEIDIDPGRKEKALALLYSENVMRKDLPVYNRTSVMRRQLQFMDKRPMALQLTGCMVLFCLVSAMSRRGWEIGEAVAVVMILSAALNFCLLSGISTIFTSKFAELSDSCYFNAKQLIAFHMVCSGLTNLTILFMAALFVGTQWKITLLQAGLYVFVPYIEIQCCCTGMVLTEAGRRRPYIAFGAGTFGCMLFLVIASVLEIFLISSIAFWSVAFVVGILIYGVQIMVLFHRIDRGEIV